MSKLFFSNTYRKINGGKILLKNFFNGNTAKANAEEIISFVTGEWENILEQKMVWLLGSMRSGTTWLGTQLLKHEQNIIWNEPYIGFHLNAGEILSHPESPDNERPDYFFSKKFQKIWMPAYKKFVLTRAYAQAGTLNKNLVIKEPHGAKVAPLLMECFPQSKLIFMMRDGRDVVDSIIDAHQRGSWMVDAKPIDTKEQRLEILKAHSKAWSNSMKNTHYAYQNHHHNLRLMLKYEDLLKNTFEELKKIYDFLKIDITEKELKKILSNYDFEKIPASQKGTGKFYRLAKPGGWKDSFNDEEVNLMNSIMAEGLRTGGYQT